MIENYDELDYNRKVDMLVAVHVFKYKDIYVQWMGNYWLCTWLGNTGPANIIPCYSTLLTSAWEIVRKFDYCYLFRSKNFKGGQWECKLYQDITGQVLGEKDPYFVWAETEQLAICYAGLKAVGFDMQGFLKEEGRLC